MNWTCCFKKELLRFSPTRSKTFIFKINFEKYDMKKARHTKARITRFQFTFTLGISFGIKVIISTTVAFENKTIASFQKTKRPLKHENIKKQKVSDISTDGSKSRKNRRQTCRCRCRCLENLYAYVKYR